MYRRISKSITKWCQKHLVMDEEESAVMEYGLRCLLGVVWNALLFVSIGMGIGKGKETVLAVLVFGTIRMYAGGAHMRSRAGCTLTSGVLIGSAVAAVILPEMSVFFITCCWCIGGIIILGFVPAEFSKKRTCQSEIKKAAKRKSMIVVSCWCLFAMLAEIGVLRNVIVTSYAAAVMTLLPIWGDGDVKEKGRNVGSGKADRYF